MRHKICRPAEGTVWRERFISDEYLKWGESKQKNRIKYDVPWQLRASKQERGRTNSVTKKVSVDKEELEHEEPLVLKLSQFLEASHFID